MKSSIAFVLGGLLLSSSALADTMAPGLWEIQNRTRIDGQAIPGIEDILKDVPPEMREQMKASMAAQGLGLENNAVRICISAEQATRNDVPVMEDENDCKVTRTEKAKGHWTFQIQCQNPAGHGEGDVRLIDNKNWTSHYRIERPGYTDYSTMEIDGTGRWISNDCGSITPQQR